MRLLCERKVRTSFAFRCARLTNSIGELGFPVIHAQLTKSAVKRTGADRTSLSDSKKPMLTHHRPLEYYTDQRPNPARLLSASARKPLAASDSPSLRRRYQCLAARHSYIAGNLGRGGFGFVCPGVGNFRAFVARERRKAPHLEQPSPI